MFDCRLALMTGADIPLPELQLAQHQPTIYEISMLGEQDFFIGIQVLCINKEMYTSDENLLEHTTNFQIFMAMMNEPQMADKKNCVIQTLSLLFPEHQALFTPRSMVLNKDGTTVMIDEGNFEILQQVLSQQFCLSGSGQEAFNPKDSKAKEIAQKLMRARQRVAEQKAHENSGSVFGQYLSILTIGLHSMSLQDCVQLTMYQLYDLVERYSLYINWDLDIRAKLAGSTDNKPVDNWMKQIH